MAEQYEQSTASEMYERSPNHLQETCLFPIFANLKLAVSQNAGGKTTLDFLNYIIKELICLVNFENSKCFLVFKMWPCSVWNSRNKRTYYQLFILQIHEHQMIWSGV